MLLWWERTSSQSKAKCECESAGCALWTCDGARRVGLRTWRNCLVSQKQVDRRAAAVATAAAPAVAVYRLSMSVAVAGGRPVHTCCRSEHKAQAQAHRTAKVLVYSPKGAFAFFRPRSLMRVGRFKGPPETHVRSALQPAGPCPLITSTARLSVCTCCPR